MSESKQIVRVGNLVIDLERNACSGVDGNCELNPRSEALLLLLVRRANQLVTRDELMQHVWAGRIVEDAAISNCVWQIRKALGPSGKDLLQTRSKRGYLLTVPPEPAQTTTATGATSDKEQLKEAQSSYNLAPQGSRLSPGEAKRRIKLVGWLIGCAASLGFLFWFTGLRSASDQVVIEDRGESPQWVTTLVAIAASRTGNPVLLASQQPKAQGLWHLSREQLKLVWRRDGEVVAGPVLREGDEAAVIPGSLLALDYRRTVQDLHLSAMGGKSTTGELVLLALALSELGFGEAAYVLTGASQATLAKSRADKELRCLNDDLRVESVLTENAEVSEVANSATTCSLAKRRAQARLGQIPDATGTEVFASMLLRLRDIEFGTRWGAARMSAEQGDQALANAIDFLGKLHWPEAQARLATQRARVAKRLERIADAKQHLQFAERLFRQQRLEADAERASLQLHLLNVGRNLTDETYQRAEALRKLCAEVGDRRGLLLAEQVLLMQEGADVVASIPAQLEKIKGLADREEAFEALNRLVTIAQWRNQPALVAEIVGPAVDSFDSVGTLAIAVRQIYAPTLGFRGEFSAASQAFLEIEMIDQKKNVGIKPKFYYCTGIASHYSAGKFDLATEWYRRCSEQDFSNSDACMKFFPLGQGITLKSVNEDVLELVVHELIEVMSRTPNRNCLAAASHAVDSLLRKGLKRPAERIIQAIDQYYPNNNVRSTVAIWNLLQF